MRYASAQHAIDWTRHVDRRIWIVLGILVLILLLSGVIM